MASKNKKNSKLAIIFYGSPGSGKGTQAKLLADKLGLYHFDTGDFLRKILNNPVLTKNKEIIKERKLNRSGKLNSPSWVLKIISKQAETISKLGQSIVCSDGKHRFNS